MNAYSNFFPAPQQPPPARELKAEEDSGDEEPKAKKTRKRAQLSCSACHQRKQKCDRETPCGRCVKRGNPEACVVMSAGGQKADRDSPPAPRKRKQQDGNEDLAERVRQLEALIMKQSEPTGTAQPLYSPPNMQSASASPSFGPMRNNSERDLKSANTAGEDAAVAALSTLAKAIPKEGGSEARIYSGPGSVAALLDASGFSASTLSAPSADGRARPSDYQLYSGARGIAGMVNAHPRIVKLADALQEQKNKMPPHQMCHYLFNFFHNCEMFKDKFMTYPRGAYQSAYDALFDVQEQDQSAEAHQARSLQFPQLSSQHSLAFISHVFAIFSLSLALSPDQSEEARILGSVMYENSRSAFFASERREQPTYSVIMALLLQSLYLKMIGSPSMGFTYMAQAIRFAQSQGMHREPGPGWNLGGLEIECRRRIWWGLCYGDKHHSIAYGRPYIIFAGHCDVAMPPNIHEKDLTAQGPQNPRPISEVTEMTSTIIQCKLAPIVSEIIDKACGITAPTYSTILELDHKLTQFENTEIPVAFKNPSYSEQAQKPYIRAAYSGTQQILWWLRSMLHRPYLLLPLPSPGQADHFIGSRVITINLSKKAIATNKEALATIPMHMQAYFACAFGAFEPAVNLATAILQDPGSAHAPYLDEQVKEAMSMLENMSHVNKVAGEGLETLMAMREKYLQKMADAKGPSPGSSISLTTGSDPSPSLYASSGPSPAAFSLASSASGNQTLAGPQIAADNAATPNTLFNQFFGGQYPSSSAPSEAKPPAAANPSQDIVNLDQLFSFDPATFNSDPSASWLTEPMAGGLDVWPTTYHRLENESSLQEWQRQLGF